MPNDEILEEQPTTDGSSDTNTDNVSSIRLPVDYLFAYSKLLLLMVELGESMLNSCKSLCDTKNMHLVECYHMLKAALAAKQLAGTNNNDDDSNNTTNSHYDKIGDTLINYVLNQLDCITENYQHQNNIVLPTDVNNIVDMFMTMNSGDINVTVELAEESQAEQIVQCDCKHKSPIPGHVIYGNSIEQYGLTQEQLDSFRYWHVEPGYEFEPGTSDLYINGVRYFQDDDDYTEWLVTDNGNVIGVGVILLSGEFDVYVETIKNFTDILSASDEISVEAVRLYEDTNEPRYTNV